MGQFESSIDNQNKKLTNFHREIDLSLRGLGLSKIHEEFSLFYAKNNQFNKIIFHGRKLENWTWALSNGYLPRKNTDTNTLLKELFKIKNNFAEEKQKNKEEVFFEKKLMN